MIRRVQLFSALNYNLDQLWKLDLDSTTLREKNKSGVKKLINELIQLEALFGNIR